LEGAGELRSRKLLHSPRGGIGSREGAGGDGVTEQGVAKCKPTLKSTSRKSGKRRRKKEPETYVRWGSVGQIDTQKTGAAARSGWEKGVHSNAEKSQTGRRSKKWGEGRLMALGG